MITSILDDFNRANSNALGANWTEGFGWGLNTDLRIDSNQLDNLTGATSDAYWNVSSPGADVEVYATIATLPGNGEWVDLVARATTGASGDGYMVEVYNDGGSYDIYLLRIDNTTASILGSVVSSGLSAGDGLGMRIVGSTLTAWRRQSGVWNTVGSSRTDSTYTAAGRLGIIVTGTTANIDDFGGGTYSPSGGVSIPVIMAHRRSQGMS